MVILKYPTPIYSIYRLGSYVAWYTNRAEYFRGRTPASKAARTRVAVSNSSSFFFLPLLPTPIIIVQRQGLSKSYPIHHTLSYRRPAVGEGCGMSGNPTSYELAPETGG